jgi:hypothetical protein
VRDHAYNPIAASSIATIATPSSHALARTEHRRAHLRFHRLILDEDEVTLHVGDVVVQRGTDHAWENRSDSLARAAFFHVDARFSEELLAKLPKPLALMT